MIRQASSRRRWRTDPGDGEEAAVGEVQHAGCEAAFQLVGQGVLPVVVAADRGADPAEGRGADVGGDPQQRAGAVRRDAELALQHAVPAQLHRGAVEGGDLQALPQQADPQVRVRDGGVELEDLFMACSPSSFLAWENALPEGTSAPGRGFRPGSPNAVASTVIAGAGEQARDQHADDGHLRGQHPVILMARGRLPQRAGDHAVAEQVLQQALPVQFRQPLRPEPRPGRNPGGHLRGLLVISPRRGRSGRRRDDHGKLGRQQGSRWVKGVSNPVPTRSFVLFQGPPEPVTPPRPTRIQTVTRP